MSYLLDFQGTRDKISKIYCWLFGQEISRCTHVKTWFIQIKFVLLVAPRLFIQQLRRFKNGRVFSGIDSCLTMITNFEQIFSIFIPLFFCDFENFTSFILYYKILKWWYKAWYLPHKSIYFMQNLICKTNEWMNVFQKRTCAWCGCNLKHLFSYILYTCPQNLITDACTNEEIEGKKLQSTSWTFFIPSFRIFYQTFFAFFFPTLLSEIE